MTSSINGLVFTLTLAFATSLHASSPPTLEWSRQFGTSDTDVGTSVSADSLGNVYISGWTTGSLAAPSASNADSDAFLRKYDASGSLQWTRQLGTFRTDQSFGVSVDLLGNAYITGHTEGSLGGSNISNNPDAFLSKYDASGTLQWTEQLGTSGVESSSGVSADSFGNVYISGTTDSSLGGPNAGSNDVFVSKYDAAGTLQWTEQLGTTGFDEGFGVSADAFGNVYISGRTEGTLGGSNAGGNDAFLSKYNTTGTLQWTQQLGTSGPDESFGVSADSLGNVYITGNTSGNLGGLNAGNSDVFVSKYDASGTLQWTEQLGTSGSDTGLDVSADSLGNVYITGNTSGSLGGLNAGNSDVFVSKYDFSGTLQWTEQLGTSGSDVGFGVSADGLGNVYISGNTNGSLSGPNAGGDDAFLVKFYDPDVVVPEPSSFFLTTLGGLFGLGVTRRRRGNELH